MLRTHENRYAEQLVIVYKGNWQTKVSKSGGPNLEYDFLDILLGVQKVDTIRIVLLVIE